jgi:hypothetical protein
MDTSHDHNYEYTYGEWGELIIPPLVADTDDETVLREFKKTVKAQGGRVEDIDDKAGLDIALAIHHQERLRKIVGDPSLCVTDGEKEIVALIEGGALFSITPPGVTNPSRGKLAPVLQKTGANKWVIGVDHVGSGAKTFLQKDGAEAIRQAQMMLADSKRKAMTGL